MKIVVATGNRKKLEEIEAVLPARFNVIAQTELGVEEAAETGLTFVENAIIKARNAARATGLPAIADDSGLEVDLLDGAPGIYSSRYAGAKATDEDNNNKLLSELEGVTEDKRGARFQCVIVMLRRALDPVPVIATGTWQGTILGAPRGTNGFGYDPLFYIEGLARTAAELDSDAKNLLSHRGQALRQLSDKLAAL